LHAHARARAQRTHLLTRTPRFALRSDAAVIANAVLAEVIAFLAPGKLVADVCEHGDNAIEAACAKVYKCVRGRGARRTSRHRCSRVRAHTPPPIAGRRRT
jgi:hypothetical protein